MNQKDINALVNLAQKLHKQKLPVIGIILIVGLAFFTGQYGLFDGFWDKIPATSSNSDACEVVKVYDGDTVTLECPGQTEKTRIRMYCIDTPEMQQKPWGQQSRDYLRDLIPLGSMVTYSEVERDRYGRVVAEIFTSDGTNLNQQQVVSGMAAVYAAYCKKPEYASLQAKAQRDKLGIWSQPGLQQAPWDWRKQK
jgi:endonuclease YncB( thermonuclease family)